MVLLVSLPFAVPHRNNFIDVLFKAHIVTTLQKYFVFLSLEYMSLPEGCTIMIVFSVRWLMSEHALKCNGGNRNVFKLIISNALTIKGL